MKLWSCIAAVLMVTLPALGAASAPPTPPLRVATFNVSLYDEQDGGLIRRLQAGDPKARKIAAIIQHQRPDLLLLNEFDYDAAGHAADLFQHDYLEVGQFGEQAIAYPYRYLAPVNTGVPSGLDLDRNGKLGQSGRGAGDDAWGYGLHPGQYGMLVLSRFPIERAQARSFQRLKWSALPRASVPLKPSSGRPWYPAKVWKQLRLSSKSHWDLPIETPLGRLHFLVAHPTPPTYDGPEDRNGHRNHDEIRLWSELLDDRDTGWLCDDQGRCGGLAAGERFVIAGDHNADPCDGAGINDAILALLANPRLLQIPFPRSDGAAEAPQDGINASQRGDPQFDTASFNPARSGNMHVDYVRPSVGFKLIDQGVFWPRAGELGAEWLDASDHRMVWVDLAE